MATGDKFYLADKDTLDGVNEKIGSESDTGGSSSVGTVMAKENAMLEKIGATNDAQSSSTTTGSIFAKLNYLVAKIVSVYSWCSSMYSWLNNIYSKFGFTTDTGGTTSTGTLMAKANAILDASGKVLLDGEKYVPQLIESYVIERSDLCSSLFYGIYAMYNDFIISSAYNGKIRIFIKSRMDYVSFEVPTATGSAIDVKSCIENNYVYGLSSTSTTISIIRFNLDTQITESLYTISNSPVIWNICAKNNKVFLLNHTTNKLMAYDVLTNSILAEVTVSMSTTTNYNKICSNGNTLIYCDHASNMIRKYNPITLELMDSISFTETIDRICVLDDGRYVLRHSNKVILYILDATEMSLTTLDHPSNMLFTINNTIFTALNSKNGFILNIKNPDGTTINEIPVDLGIGFYPRISTLYMYNNILYGSFSDNSSTTTTYTDTFFVKFTKGFSLLNYTKEV